MAEIKDEGKVWIREQPGTVFAVKVDDKVYVPGREDRACIEYWLEGDFLCVDIHNPDHKTRIARKFPLNLEAIHPATLFNGFTKTKHADVRVITFEDPGVDEKLFKDQDYLQAEVQSMSRETFWQRAGFPR